MNDAARKSEIESLRSVLVSAIEAGRFGIGCWAETLEYNPDAGTATIRDHEADPPKDYNVTLETVRLGLQRMRDGQVTCVGKPWVHGYHVWARFMADEGESDGPDADNIVQAGLFGEIVYG